MTHMWTVKCQYRPVVITAQLLIRSLVKIVQLFKNNQKLTSDVFKKLALSTPDG